MGANDYELALIWAGGKRRWSRDYTGQGKRNADAWNRAHGPMWWRALHWLRPSTVIQ